MSENQNNMRTLTLNTRMEVPVALGTLEYIADIDPVESWYIVTRRDMDQEEFEKLRKRHFGIVAESEKTKEFQDRLKKHLDECINLYNGIMSRDGDTIKAYTEGRTFNFVLGMPATGGTTLYQALSDAYGWPWQTLLLSMTHNYMPNGRYCVELPQSEFDMGWRYPWNFNNLIFEFCQFLVYTNNVAPDCENMFLKSTGLSYAVKFLNYLFGDKANYFVTVRHPAAILLDGVEEGQEITKDDHMNNMAMWTNLYSSIIRECRPLGKVHTVPYGPGLTDFINDVLEKTEFGDRLEETTFFEYDDYDKDFYESEAVKRLFQYVSDSWKLFDLEFPVPDKCI